MGTENEWSDEIAEKVGDCKGKLSEKDYKRLRLSLLVRVAKRVETFAADCAECESLKTNIVKLVEGIPELADAAKEKRKTHRKGVQAVINHLEKRHKLTCEGDYTSLGISFGLMFGVAVGAAMDNVAIGISLGMCLGVAFGAAFEADAKKKGRMI